MGSRGDEIDFKLVIIHKFISCWMNSKARDRVEAPADIHARMQHSPHSLCPLVVAAAINQGIGQLSSAKDVDTTHTVVCLPVMHTHTVAPVRHTPLCQPHGVVQQHMGARLGAALSPE